MICWVNSIGLDVSALGPKFLGMVPRNAETSISTSSEALVDKLISDSSPSEVWRAHA